MKFFDFHTMLVCTTTKMKYKKLSSISYVFLDAKLWQVFAKERKLSFQVTFFSCIYLPISKSAGKTKWTSFLLCGQTPQCKIWQTENLSNFHTVQTRLIEVGQHAVVIVLFSEIIPRLQDCLFSPTSKKRSGSFLRRKYFLILPFKEPD